MVYGGVLGVLDWDFLKNVDFLSAIFVVSKDFN